MMNWMSMLSYGFLVGACVFGVAGISASVSNKNTLSDICILLASISIMFSVGSGWLGSLI